MPKLEQGRLSGYNGMESHTAAELYAWADKLEAQIGDPENSDDPRYLKRWAGKMRKLASQKEKAREHKDQQRRPESVNKRACPPCPPREIDDGNPYAPPAAEGTNLPPADIQYSASRLGLASLLCALIFPMIMWGGTFADACGILGPTPPGARSAVALLFTISSLSAVVLAICSFCGGVRMTALIGLIVGAVEFFMCLGFMR